MRRSGARLQTTIFRNHKAIRIPKERRIEELHIKRSQASAPFHMG